MKVERVCEKFWEVERGICRGRGKMEGKGMKVLMKLIWVWFGVMCDFGRLCCVGVEVLLVNLVWDGCDCKCYCLWLVLLVKVVLVNWKCGLMCGVLIFDDRLM